MDGNIDRYTTWETEALVESMDPAFSFLIDTFFTTPRQFTTEHIEWDIKESGQVVAPFVSPFALGASTRRNGFRTFQLKPAYIKLLDTVRPEEGWTRRPGEPYGGNMSVQQRLDLQVAEQVLTHINMIRNRMEVMARDVLLNAKITISTDGYPTATVDFERPAVNTTNAGTVWTDSNSTPLADIQTHAKTINRSSKGAVVNTLLMAGSVFDIMMAHADIRELVNRDKNLSPGTRGLEFGPRDGSSEAKYRGTLASAYDIWTYDGYFEDDLGVAQELMPDDKIIMLASGGIMGTQFNGAIQDMDAGMQALPIFVKSRNLWNPSGVEVLTQSAPMVAMKRPAASGVLANIKSGG